MQEGLGQGIFYFDVSIVIHQKIIVKFTDNFLQIIKFRLTLNIRKQLAFREYYQPEGIYIAILACRLKWNLRNPRCCCDYRLE